MKTASLMTSLLVLGLVATACSAEEAPVEATTDVGELNGAGGGGRCHSPTLGRNVRKYDCVQDSECNWNQCDGNGGWAGFSNDVCAPVKPWQNPPCNGGSDPNNLREGTYPNPSCAFFVPARDEAGHPGTCDANPAPAPPPPSPSTGSAKCFSDLNPGVTIKAYDCFEHAGWWQCRPDGEWERAIVEPNGKVFGPLTPPGANTPGCAVQHRR